MTMIKCDRCGEVNESGTKIIVHEGGMSLSDCKIEDDLCDECKKKLYDFFKPVPRTFERS
jgi:hypothetical protein